jgi:nicotinamidase-related amidase
MTFTSLLSRERALVVVIDMQEAYRSVLHGWDAVAVHVRALVEGAALLGVPILVTEQYPKGLGGTASEIAAVLPPGTTVVQKLSLSCCGAPPFVERLRASGRSQVLVAGIETHACVTQTVLELLGAGYETHVARDATSSRRAASIEPAWQRMLAAGMSATTVEQALLEVVRSAEAPEFKPLQRLLKTL